MKELRWFQDRAIQMLRDSLKSGKRRPVCQMPTGAGKTVVAAEMIRSCQAKGKRALFVVDAISLVDQTVERFAEHGINGIGVIQGQHVGTDWSQPVQVASVQTMERRGMPLADLVIVDEAHCQRRWLLDQMKDHPAPWIGLSATPWSKGLGNHFDDLIIPVTMQELIDQGYLSPFHVYAPSHPDLRGVKITAGDYQEDDLARVMGDNALIGEVVETWKKLANYTPTLAFCVNRDHAAQVQERFVQAGIPWGYIDALTEPLERKAIEGRLNRGEIFGVSNVGCLTKGVDWAIGCVILARPTKSASLAVQMIGRALRVNPGIGDAVILDHSDTVLRLGFPTDIHRTKLCTAKKGEPAQNNEERPPAKPRECKTCHRLMPPQVRICPACGAAQRAMGQVSEGVGQLVELTAGRDKSVKAKAKPVDKRRFFAELRGMAQQNGKSEGWALAMFRARYNEWPHGKNGVQPIAPSAQTVSYVRSRNIAYAKSKQRGEQRA